MLPILGKALGVRAEEMIECELIPEARGLGHFSVRSWIDIPLAECFAVHMEEEIFGFISRYFRQLLPKYGITDDDMKYFRVHEEADLDEEMAEPTRRNPQVALQKKATATNALAGRWNIAVKLRQMISGNFYDGIYRRFA